MTRLVTLIRGKQVRIMDQHLAAVELGLPVDFMLKTMDQDRNGELVYLNPPSGGEITIRRTYRGEVEHG